MIVCQCHPETLVKFLFLFHLSFGGDIGHGIMPCLVNMRCIYQGIILSLHYFQRHSVNDIIVISEIISLCGFIQFRDILCHDSVNCTVTVQFIDIISIILLLSNINSECIRQCRIFVSNNWIEAPESLMLFCRQSRIESWFIIVNRSIVNQIFIRIIGLFGTASQTWCCKISQTFAQLFHCTVI